MNRRTFLKSSTALVALAPLVAMTIPRKVYVYPGTKTGLPDFRFRPMTMDDLNELFYGDNSIDPFVDNRAKVIDHG